MNAETISYTSQLENRVRLVNPKKDILSIKLFELPSNLACVSLQIGSVRIRLCHLDINVNLLESITCGELQQIPVSFAYSCGVYLEFHWDPPYQIKTKSIKLPIYSEEDYLQKDEEGIFEGPIVIGYTDEPYEEKVETLFSTPAFEVTWVDPVSFIMQGRVMDIYEDYLLDPNNAEHQKVREEARYGLVKLENNHIRLQNSLYISRGAMGKRMDFGLPLWTRACKVV